MRQLATVQRIESISPIEGADAIECARVLGWNVVVKRGDFSVGDRVVYCEIDSLLPERQDFEFLRKGCYRAPIIQGGQELLRGGFRIKTVRLRGQVSQGICFPVSILPPNVESMAEVGDDVTDALDIVKYEPPLPAQLNGVAKGNFPSFIPKTDETRVQNLAGLLRRHSGAQVYITEKLDGSSMTVFRNGDDLGVCSRNMWLDSADATTTFAQVTSRLGLPERLPDHTALQGELVGPGIQGNLYGLKSAEFFVFGAYNIATQSHMEWSYVLELAGLLGLQTVPQLGYDRLVYSIDEWVEISRRRSALNPQVHREGIVARAVPETADHRNGRVSFKAINPDFLLKHEK